jgi:hypothetical protein
MPEARACDSQRPKGVFLLMLLLNACSDCLCLPACFDCNCLIVNRTGHAACAYHASCPHQEGERDPGGARDVLKLVVVVVVGRAWIGLEVGMRAADRDSSMVELSDPYGSAEKYYLARMSGTPAVDFISNFTASVQSDVTMIKDGIQSDFTSEYHEGDQAAVVFNKTIDDWIRLAGGIQRIERLFSLPTCDGDKVREFLFPKV